MSYQHILVAVDLTEESRILVEKATALAKALNSELSLIHVEQRFGEIYPGQVTNAEIISHASEKAIKQSHQVLQVFIDNSDYPIKMSLVGAGDIVDELEDAVRLHHVDLIVCGHHQDFWHSILSSAKQILKSSPIDILIVPLP
ncbi:universal stress protein [Vibrio sp. SCSIO 43137]|uniref:universal stress protein n=1 Tax=Vibrio sp. SCSIO 43137 TaxID=3021011 RepID=UPI002306FB3A|nr:universal stress protein [Vibrio sp. SCSIO 43137]WCE30314.1 universal stress protein [Vibrio sp. SCSIO 43137]